MKLVTIAEHTIDVDRLTPGGWVLDGGCRNFGFARGLVERGCRVLAIDADPTVVAEDIPGVQFLHRAIAAEAGTRSLVMSSDPQARYLTPVGSTAIGGEKVEAMTIIDLMEPTDGLMWDVVKLDVEGAEYDILQAWPMDRPLAKQISIEFHEHVRPRPPELYDAIFNRLSKFYDVVQHVSEAKYCAGYNYWDSLLVLRDGL